MNKGVKITLRIFIWIAGIIISLLLLLFLFIQVPAVQNYARKKAVSFIQNKIGTSVEIEKLSIALPKLIVLKGIYFEDQNQDTLLAGEIIKVDISLIKLFKKQLQINEIYLQGINVNIHRTLPDGVFNYDFIVKAFSKAPNKNIPIDTAIGMKISVDKINLNRIRVSFKDAVTANDVRFQFDHFETRFREFDLDKKKFSIPDIKLSGLIAVIVQSKPAIKQESTSKVEADSNKPIDLDLKIGTIDFTKIWINYQNDVSNLKTNLDLGKLFIDVESINLKNQRIALKNIKLSNTKAAVVLGKSEQAKVVVKEVSKVVIATLNNDWRATIGKVDFSNIGFKYDDYNKPVKNKGMDYAHLALTGLRLQAKAFSYSQDTISGQISEGIVRNKDGFVLSALRTDFLYCNTGVVLKDLNLETPGTILGDYIRITYPSLDSMAKNPGAISIEANLKNNRLSLKDILTFAPQLSNVELFKNNPDAVLNITANVKGSMDRLNIPDFLLTGFGNTRINLSGNISGLPDMNRAKFDLTIHEFKSGSKDLNQLLPTGIVPTTIRLPEDFKISGRFNGGLNSFTTKLDMNSSYGIALISAGLQNGNRKGNEALNASIELVDFNAGHLLKQDSLLGKISGHAQVTGKSTNPKTMIARFNVVATSAEVKGYIYKNMTLDGNITNQNLLLTAKMTDQNLRFNLDAKANIKNKFPSVDFTLNIDTLNLQNLNLSDSNLRITGKIVANLPYTNPDSLIGTVTASGLSVHTNKKAYQLDSITIFSDIIGNEKDLEIHSGFLTASLRGQYNFTQISPSLVNEINKYFKIGNGEKKPVSNDQVFNFTLNITNRPIVQEFVPLLTYLGPVQVKGSFNSKSGGLKIEATAPKITYSGVTVDSVRLAINSDGKALKYNLHLDKISRDSLLIYKTDLYGMAQENLMNVTLNVKDKNDKNKYNLPGQFSVSDGQYRFSFNRDGLVLNYDSWSVTPENFVQFGSKGILADNLKLSVNDQIISVNSNPQLVNSPLKIDFTNFKISTITAFVASDNFKADGIINGNADLSNLESSPVFAGNLTVKDFSFQADTIGNINVKVNNKLANTYAANITISGKGNDVVLGGEYYLKPQNQSSFKFDLDIRKLNLATIEGFSMNNLKNASGNINGKFAITGTTKAPSILGDLRFNQVAFNIVKFNSYYTIADEKVSFTGEGIHFDTFTMVDSIGNKAIIDGSLYTVNYLDYRFGLTVNSKNFKVLNSTKKDNKLFYGKLLIDSDLKIGGNLGSPVVEGNLRINQGTDLTFVMPQNDPGIVEREGVVEFVNMKDLAGLTNVSVGSDTINSQSISGMDISVKLVADTSAAFSLIIDEANGDFVKMQGDMQLAAGIDPSGKMNLTGTYEVTKGTYELSFNFLKRRFSIQRGSTITWQGEPTKADVNVTAVYLANTAPYDLVEGKLDEPKASLNRYKQKLPFEVTLNMQGELMKPLLTFDIALPRHNYNVAQDVVDNVQYQLTQLRTQPSELNKQVFALLLLNRFVAENPFTNGAGGGGIASLARSSVSKILSEQMNKLAGDLINGVDLNFDLVSSDDYTTGTLQNHTELNLGVSKQLLNDRLKVTIGSNFELEGPRNTNQNASNIAGNLALDYQLSNDGRYMLRAYRKNEYQGVAEGYLIETGIGFIFTIDYTQFKEIFVRKDQMKKNRNKIKKKIDE